MGMYFIIALVVGTLTTRLRVQAQTLQSREERTEALYALAHEVASAVTMEDVLRAAVTQIGQVFDAEVAFLLPDENGQLMSQPHSASTLAVDEKERSVAVWVFQNHKPAGRHTATLPLADARYLPLLTPNGVVGVLGIRWSGGQRLSFDQETLLETFAKAHAADPRADDADYARAVALQRAGQDHCPTRINEHTDESSSG